MHQAKNRIIKANQYGETIRTMRYHIELNKLPKEQRMSLAHWYSTTQFKQVNTNPLFNI